MSSVTPAAAPGSWPAPAPSTLWSVVVWRWRGQRRCGLTPPRPPRATHLYVRRNTKLRSNDLRPVRVVGRYNVPVHPGRSVVVPPAVRALRAARPLGRGPPGAAMAPALLRGAPDPTRPREPDPPAPDAAPLRSATPQPPRAEPTGHTSHPTHDKRGYIPHRPRVARRTQSHQTPHLLMVTYAPWYLTISLAVQSIVDRTCCLTLPTPRLSWQGLAGSLRENHTWADAPICAAVCGAHPDRATREGHTSGGSGSCTHTSWPVSRAPLALRHASERCAPLDPPPWPLLRMLACAVYWWQADGKLDIAMCHTFGRAPGSTRGTRHARTRGPPGQRGSPSRLGNQAQQNSRPPWPPPAARGSPVRCAAESGQTGAVCRGARQRARTADQVACCTSSRSCVHRPLRGSPTH